MKKLTNDEFIKRAINIHGGEYDYSLVNYINCRTNVNIVCEKHGIFSQNPRHHIEKGSKCPQCQNEKLSKRFALNINDFIKRAINVHGNKYDYSKVKYINGSTKIKIGCNIHGVFSQIPNNHLNGANCPSCKESLGEKKIAEYLNNNYIKFQRQVSFDGLIGNKNSLYYDFYLPEHKMMIEFDGIQHSEPIKFFGGVKKFKKQKKYDRKKIDYVIFNGYKLLKLSHNTFPYLEEALMCELKNNKILC